MLRTLDNLRSEHQLALAKEEELKSAEQERMDAWIKDLRESHKAKKEHLLSRIVALESSVRVSGATETTGMCVCSVSENVVGSNDDSVPTDEVRSTGVTEIIVTTTTTVNSSAGSGVTSASTGATTIGVIVESESSVGVSSAGTMTTVPLVSTLASSGLPGTECLTTSSLATGTGQVTLGLSPAAVEFIPTSPSIVSHPVIHSVTTLVSGTVPGLGGITRMSEPSARPPTTTGTVSGSDGVHRETSGVSLTGSSVMETFTQLLKAQTAGSSHTESS